MAFNKTILLNPAPYRGIIIDLEDNGDHAIMVSYMDDISVRLSEQQAQSYVAWMMGIVKSMNDQGYPMVFHIEDYPDKPKH